jgi:CRP-like cAMP-binding protein
MQTEIAATKRLLRECGLFSALSDAELTQVASAASDKEFEAGATIFQEGEAAEDLYVLREGKVALQMALPASQTSAVRRITIDIVGAGQVFGWSAMVHPHLYTLTAVCLQRARVVVISGTKLSQLLDGDPRLGYEVMKGFIKLVASRLDDTRHVLLSERSFT